MSRKSDYGRLNFALCLDRYGIIRTPTEAERFRKAKRKKKLQRQARKRSRK